MQKKLFFIILLAAAQVIKAQNENMAIDTTWKKIYRSTYPRVNDLVHTRLQATFDYDKTWMYGKVWITLKPHFYTTDSLKLDAKGMEIKEVALVKGNLKIPLKYTNTGMELFIKLDKSYKATEKYTVYIDYTSKPNELRIKGSQAITDAKGLYFINPTGEDKDKPVQIWTQGETEGTSVWVPTIDKPNQKTTQEIYMTVPSKYVTLSNGLQLSKKDNTDGTRTDYWKMDLPHAPYLFFMGVGDFAIIKDNYKGKEVSYYVEKIQAPYAKGVFGTTPEMIQFFSEKLGVEYPWPKYAQMVGRDFVSGAMENTTATLHQESAYQNFRQLTEGNSWEGTIAHELFHQWFGDLVTAESWSNLTVNESFANYSEVLWSEYKHGKDAGDEHNLQDMQGYLQSGSEQKDLVRFSYADKEEMFDAVSYNKGGRILHMLRNYVGDDAFFKSLNNYLSTNKFKSAEAAQLRLAFEEVTGEDLNWFFNQWYYGSGHPVATISYAYTAGKVYVYLKQTQAGNKIFKLPLSIDIYTGNNKKRFKVWAENKTDTFVFDYPSQPDLVNVDADKVILWSKTDNKTAEDFVFQYQHAQNYMDRKEALEYFAAKGMKELALGINDKYAGLRKETVEALSALPIKDASLLSAVEKMVETEKNKKAKAAAIQFLAGTKDVKYQALYNKYINDSSYSVVAASLEGLSFLDPVKSYELAKKYSIDSKGALSDAISKTLMENGTDADFDFISDKYNEAPANQNKLDLSAAYCNYLTKLTDVVKIRKGVDYVIKFRNLIPEQFRNFTDPVFKAGFQKIAAAKGGELATYLATIIK